MREMDAFEQAYKNGYAAGVRDTEAKIVRCRECKRGNLCLNLAGAEYVDCVLDDYSVRKPTDFCSYGERRNE